MHFSPFVVSFSPAQRMKQFFERKTYFMIIFMREFYCIQRDLRLNQCAFAIQQQQLLIIIYAHSTTYEIFAKNWRRRNIMKVLRNCKWKERELLMMMMTPSHASCTEKCTYFYQHKIGTDWVRFIHNALRKITQKCRTLCKQNWFNWANQINSHILRSFHLDKFLHKLNELLADSMRAIQRRGEDWVPVSKANQNAVYC